MKYYPIFMDVAGKPCLVVGGGKVGARKAKGLAAAGAQVKVVSPEFDVTLVQASHPCIFLEQKTFDPRDLDGVLLVFAATDSMVINTQVRQAARQAGILCNVADTRDKGDFILPSVVNRGDLQVAVSTSGASPAVAKQLRTELEASFGPEYGIMLTLMAGARKLLLEQGHDPAGHKQIFTRLAQAGLPAMIAANNIDQINLLLSRLLGEKVTFDGLTGQACTSEEL